MKIFILDAKQISSSSVELVCLTLDFRKIILIVKDIYYHSYVFLKKEDTDRNSISTFLSLHYNLFDRQLSFKKVQRRYFHNSKITDHPISCFRIRYPGSQRIPTTFFDKNACRISHIFSGHGDLVEELFIRRNLYGWVEVACEGDVVRGDKAFSTKDYDETDHPSSKDILACALYMNPNEECFLSDQSLSNDSTLRDVEQKVAKSQVSVVYTYKNNLKLKETCVIDIYPYMLEFYPKQANYDINVLAGLETTDLQKAEWILTQAQNMDLLNILLNLSDQTLLPLSRLSIRTNRVEWLIMRRMRAIRCVYPENDRKKIEASVPYTAGLVLDAKQGIYTTPVSLLDFTSMYPSVCVEQQICWTSDGSVIAHLMKTLIQKRKDILTNAHLFISPAAASLATKLLANTMYGTLAFAYSRFYTPAMASRIAARGRELLISTVGFINKHYPGNSIIYGDTDSVMVSCDKELALEIAERINNNNHPAIQLKYEDTYKKLVIFAKKRYIAASQTGSISFKGVDSKKRGICRLGGMMCADMLTRLLESEVLEIEDFKEILSRYSKVVESASLPTEDFVITKKLSRDPEKYFTTQGLAHVQAALLATQVTGLKYKKFDFVRYFVGAREEMFPDLQNFQDKPIDKQWYLAHINSIADRVMSILPGYKITDLIIKSSPPQSPRAAPGFRSHVELKCYCSEVIPHKGFSSLLERAKMPHVDHISTLELSPLPQVNCPNCGTELDEDSVESINLNSNSQQLCKLVYFDLKYVLSQFDCCSCQQHAAAAFLPNIRLYYNLKNLF